MREDRNDTGRLWWAVELVCSRGEAEKACFMAVFYQLIGLTLLLLSSFLKATILQSLLLP